ncbi:hypothetical protein A6R68_20603 [Neotoma lepida]|uniref:Uncharacterized protein n=1 Tax=Neotoma lepida TaxID=56216 RepID=A0A1A6HTZ3_NEOLE|nr:hypothetical protein A6R68_20603 [Neotoma lepida]
MQMQLLSAAQTGLCQERARLPGFLNCPSEYGRREKRSSLGEAGTLKIGAKRDVREFRKMRQKQVGGVLSERGGAQYPGREVNSQQGTYPGRHEKLGTMLGTWWLIYPVLSIIGKVSSPPSPPPLPSLTHHGAKHHCSMAISLHMLLAEGFYHLGIRLEKELCKLLANQADGSLESGKALKLGGKMGQPTTS